jgi:hypothetical protein
VQEESNDAVRGRVLAVQFTLANALGIPPMLFVGSLADVYGIPLVTLAIGAIVGLLALLNIFALRSINHAAARRPSPAAEDVSLNAPSDPSSPPTRP